MIKKLLVAIIIALPTMAFAQKFGVVNTADLMESLPDVKEAETQLGAASKKYEDEFKSLQDEFQKKLEELQKMEESTPEAIKQRRVSEMQELEQKIQQFRATAQEDLQRQHQQLMAPIQTKVMQAITAVGSEGNFTMIYEQANPILYVGSDVADVTALVKAKLGIK